MCSNKDSRIRALYERVCISLGLLASPVHAVCRFFFPLSLFILFGVNLMLLKAAETLPSQIGASHAFACDRQTSERFLRRFGNGDALALPQDQTPTSISSPTLLHPPAPRHVTPVLRSPVPGGMLWNLYLWHCCETKQHPCPLGAAGEPCQPTSL